MVRTASFGTSSSFVLRLGQTLFSSASLLFMCFNDDEDFYAYTAFCYLVTVMGLVTPWSVTLALMEAYSIILQKLPMQATVISVIVAGDFVLSFLSLGGACSTVSVAVLLIGAGEKQCDRIIFLCFDQCHFPDGFSNIIVFSNL
ncbi:Casparian strip membrane protein domain [Arabidopsis suecica]|uniref:CASP-like protein n=1 Tax=Arabidopsis suecica TaxID=45249 RepID=A0A8T1YFI4_ARASU|nr:Casparian strip membrane protein domain [Arabidopsis suecica]